MPKLQNEAMNHIHNRLKNGTSSGSLGEFAQIAYGHVDGETELGNVTQAVLKSCTDQCLDYYADMLPKKLVVTLMKTFKKMQMEGDRKMPMAKEFHVVEQKNQQVRRRMTTPERERRKRVGAHAFWYIPGS